MTPNWMHVASVLIWQYSRVGAPVTVLIGLCWLCRWQARLAGIRNVDGAPMIFTSQSGLLDPSRAREWDAWYLDHLAVMAAVPGIGSAQRLIAIEAGPPPSLAIYTVASPAVFETADYLRIRGMGPWRDLIDRRHYRRNLFEGLESAPEVPPGGIFVVADRDSPRGGNLTWLRAIGLDRSTPFRGVAILADERTARQMADAIGGPIALYRPVTARLIGKLG
jgi:hypothetical protein